MKHYYDLISLKLNYENFPFTIQNIKLKKKSNGLNNKVIKFFFCNIIYKLKLLIFIKFYSIFYWRSNLHAKITRKKLWRLGQDFSFLFLKFYQLYYILDDCILNSQGTRGPREVITKDLLSLLTRYRFYKKKRFFNIFS